jgi:hypothetical protein
MLGLVLKDLLHMFQITSITNVNETNNQGTYTLVVTNPNTGCSSLAGSTPLC